MYIYIYISIYYLSIHREAGRDRGEPAGPGEEDAGREEHAPVRRDLPERESALY